MASFAMVAILNSGCGFRSEPADVVLHNGHILTLDASDREAQAVAVRAGRVVEVGAERAAADDQHGGAADLLDAVCADAGDPRLPAVAIHRRAARRRSRRSSS